MEPLYKRDYGHGKKKLYFKKIYFIPIFFIILLIFPQFFPATPEKPENLSSEAFVISTNFVEQTLKAPSTAHFPTFDFKSEYLGDGRYKVTSYVDAQNSFGAKIRTWYQATLKYKGGDWADYTNWTLEDLKIE